METAKISDEFVKLTVTTEGSDLGCERSFNRNITVGELKQRLELLTGAAYNRMKLEVRGKSATNEVVDNLNEDDRKLCDYSSIQNGVLLKVIDPLMVNVFDDTDGIEKVSISEDRYKQISNVRGFMQKYGNPRFGKQPEQNDKINELERNVETVSLKGIQVGKRCEVRTKGNPPRRGVVKYIGELCVKPGSTYVGVHLDEPLGKNDGTVGKTRYFECEPNYGIFVRPVDLEVGDFPEIGLDENVEDLDEI